LLPNLTALQNVEIAMSISELPNKERAEKAKRLLKLVDLSERETHVPSELSGGEKQRVAVARALANDPSFLLADEPTGNLDSKSGTDVMNLIRDLWKTKQTTIVMVTHEPVVAQYSQRAIHIRDGMIESEEKMRGAGSASAAGKKIDLKLK
ncbi:MAG: ATP-binding cassette domain-containing protein, partial [Candidatus Micrarchaeota archaeon]